MPDFLKRRGVLILTAALVLHAAVFYSISHGEAVPELRPLDDFPRQIGSWQMTDEGVVAPEIRAVLNADEYLSRDYATASSRLPANLFIEYFRTQRTGQTPHTPKNCLPGSGWVWTSYSVVPVSIPGRADPIEV